MGRQDLMEDRNGEMLNALIRREYGSSESGGGHYGISSDGESIGQDDQDDLLGIDKQEDLAEDLSFSSSSHGGDSRLIDSNRS